jgi:hypothetical protein
MAKVYFILIIRDCSIVEVAYSVYINGHHVLIIVSSRFKKCDKFSGYG